MDYSLTTCPVCGSPELKKIGTEEHDNQIFPTYRCCGCDAISSGYAKYKKKLKEEAKKKEQLLSEKQAETSPQGDAASVYKKNIACVVEINGMLGDDDRFGTGVVLSKDGYAITNAHVVTEVDKKHESILNLCEQVEGTLGNRDACYDSDFVYADAHLDLAVIKIDGEDDMQPVEFSSTPLEIGEKIFVIGNSKGEGLCIVEGIVSDINRRLRGNDYIMITAPVTTGNSGGPVFNTKGELVGIVCCGHNDTSAMNYILPSQTIIRFIEDVNDKEGCDITFEIK